MPRGVGDGISTWIAGVNHQSPFGFEAELSQQMWQECLRRVGHNVATGYGSPTFCRCHYSYKAYDDNNCILNLALCFEVMANKRFLADGVERPGWETTDLLQID